MPEHIGTIKSAGLQAKEDGSGGTVFLMEVDKTKYWLFHNSQQQFATENIGKPVKVTYEQSGKFRNVNSIEPASQASPQGVAAPFGPPEQAAVRMVIDLYIADKLDEENPMVVAAMKWISRHLTGLKADTKSEAPLFADKPQPASPPKAKTDRDPSTITTRLEFERACYDDFRLQPRDAWHLTGQTPAPTADWAQLYRQVEASRG